MKVKLREDGICTEEINVSLVEIIDGVLVINDREIKITDKLCLIAHED